MLFSTVERHYCAWAGRIDKVFILLCFSWGIQAVLLVKQLVEVSLLLYSIVLGWATDPKNNVNG